MLLSELSIKRPVAMSCLLIGLALLGLNAWRKMGLELMPKSDLPFITIVTVYPGAGPREIETDVAKRIEDAVGTIDGLKHVSSVCMDNVCQTMLEFQLGVNVDIAATDVREKIDLIRSDFPVEVENPKIQKYDVNAKPIITLALTGDAPLDELYDYADNAFRDRVSTVLGVADVELIGGARREVQVLLDRGRLAARGLSSLQVVQAIEQGVKLIPVGRVRGEEAEYNVKFDADYKQIQKLADLQIAGAGGARVRLRDVGRVVMGTKEVRRTSWIDGKPCVAIRIIKKADANAAAVTRRVRRAFDALRAELPGGMDLVWVTDDGAFIEATNRSAWINVLEGVLLTAAILFFFLYNLRALLVVSITMPLTVVIGLFFMQLLGYTLNTSTLVAIGMSIGILITNSIVVMEAIVRRLDKRGDPVEAARLGSGDVFVAVLASAGTNLVVLFPLGIMGSLVGVFFRPLAWTMFIMTVVSLFLSFTLTPMLSALLLKPKDVGAGGRLQRLEAKWNRGLDAVTNRYRRILRFNEQHRTAAMLALVVTVLLFLQSLWLGGRLGFGFFTEPDRGEIFVKLEFSPRNNLAATSRRVRDVATQLSDLPDLRHVLAMVGKAEGVIGQSSEGVNIAQILLRFSDRTERRENMDDLMALIHERLRGLPGAIQSVAVASIVGGQGAPVQMEISGPDLAVLDKLALRAQQAAKGIKGLRDIDTTVRPGKLEVRIVPDRPVLADTGLDAVSLGMALRANIEGLKAGVYRSGARSYDIKVKMAEQSGRRQIEAMQFPGVPGHPLALPALARTKNSTAPTQIIRVDKQRTSKLFANLDASLPLGTAVRKLSKAFLERGPLPPGYRFRFAQEAEYMREAQAAMGEAGLMALILVILTLSAILESFRQPWLILVTLPLGLIGVLWALALSGLSLDMFVLMSLVMMVGIVVNNAILIMDRFNVLLAEGRPRHQAMITAAVDRFRPVVMITIAAVLGMLPLAFGRGIGADLRNSVGIASIGGILVSGVLTLILLPILYDLFTRRGQTGKE